MRLSLAALAVMLVTAAGCDSSYNDPLTAPKREVNPGAFGVQVDPMETRSARPRPEPPQQQPEATPATPATPAVEEDAQTEPSAAAENTVREEVHVGVGDKGSRYGGGIVTTPVQVFWHVRERVTFDKVKHDLDLYKALNGKAPQSHDEFMEKVIKANRTKLPSLPPGHRYVYDVEKEELMVESSR